MIVALAALMGLVIGGYVGLRIGIHVCCEVAKSKGVDLTADSANVREVKARAGYESEL
jgi:hypothetical protein